MAIYADEVSTWDRDAADGGPCRPSLAQVGGAQQINGTPAPDPTMPTAQALNQHEYQLAALGAVVPFLEVSVHWTNPSDAVVVAFASTSATLSIGDINVYVNDTGDVVIGWPAAKFPPTNVRPTASVNINASAGFPSPFPAAPACGLTTSFGNPAAQVYLADTTGNPAAFDFTLTVR